MEMFFSVFFLREFFLLFRFSHFCISKHALQLSHILFIPLTSTHLFSSLAVFLSTPRELQRPGLGTANSTAQMFGHEKLTGGLDSLSLAGYSRLLPPFDQPQGAFRPFPHLLTVSLRESQLCFHTCGFFFAAGLQGPWE